MLNVPWSTALETRESRPCGVVGVCEVLVWRKCFIVGGWGVYGLFLACLLHGGEPPRGHGGEVLGNGGRLPVLMYLVQLLGGFPQKGPEGLRRPLGVELPHVVYGPRDA